MSSPATPILFGLQRSVYTRIARLALEEKGVPYLLREVEIFGPGGVPGTHLERHPFGRIPVFQHGAFALYETGAINRYIDEAFPGPPLQPAGVEQRARMNQVIGILDSYAYRPMVWGVFVQRVSVPSSGGSPDESLIADSLDAARTSLAALEALMGEAGFLAGQFVSLADLHAFPMLRCFCLAPEGQAALERHVRLYRWYQAMLVRPSVMNTTTCYEPRPTRSRLNAARVGSPRHRGMTRRDEVLRSGGTMRKSARWNGTLVLGTHFALLQGHAAPTEAHAHYAHQVLIASDGTWVVETEAGIQRGPRLLVPSFQSHAVLAAPAQGCIVWLEPSHVDAQALLARLPDLPVDPGTLPTCLHRLVDTMPLDRRVRAALAELEARLPGRIAASDIAHAAHLSESQMHRRFRQDLAVSLRGWVLWRRLREAMVLVMDGHSLTVSAHGAGFADLAHFSRSLRRMFGVRVGHLSGLRLQHYAEDLRSPGGGDGDSPCGRSRNGASSWPQ